jgi:hypothetical protein
MTLTAHFTRERETAYASSRHFLWPSLSVLVSLYDCSSFDSQSFDIWFALFFETKKLMRRWKFEMMMMMKMSASVDGNGYGRTMDEIMVFFKQFCSFEMVQDDAWLVYQWFMLNFDILTWFMLTQADLLLVHAGSSHFKPFKPIFQAFITKTRSTHSKSN